MTHEPDAAMTAHHAGDLALALALADAADAVTMRRFLALDLIVETKPDLTPVTDADREVEQALRAQLQMARPDDRVLGEEYGGDIAPPTHGRRWIIDPIDGTKNFVRGVPVWSTLIALAVDDTISLGVVTAPALQRRWWAHRGSGAWTSIAGRPPRALGVSNVSALSDASLSYSDEAGWGERAAAFTALREQVWRTRAYGDFWSHMLVAEGAVDLAVEPELSLWDIAALVPIIEESGGRVTGFEGQAAAEAGCAVTSNGTLHAAALSALSHGR
jgi:histidinol-phosphatase